MSLEKQQKRQIAVILLKELRYLWQFYKGLLTDYNMAMNMKKGKETEVVK